MLPLFAFVSWLVLGVLAEVELPLGYSRGVPALWHDSNFIPVAPPLAGRLSSRIVAQDPCLSGPLKDPKCKVGVCCQEDGSCCGSGCCPSG